MHPMSIVLPPSRSGVINAVYNEAKAWVYSDAPRCIGNQPITVLTLPPSCHYGCAKALRRDVTVSDTPEAAPFGSNAMRAHEPGLLLRLQRHASAIASQMGALGANLEAADAKLR